MALFEFKLKSIKDIYPWGEKPHLELHWFGLTDGEYFMNVGKSKLFEYSNEILDFWKKEYPDDNIYRYVDYQITRLYEDLLENLSNILQPIPDYLHNLISTQSKFDSWNSQIKKNGNKDLSKDMYETYMKSILWIESCRNVSTMHLFKGPLITIWRHKNTIHIRWDNRQANDNGIDIWSAKTGEITLSHDKFIHEVKLFHEKLFKEMESRINYIENNNPLPNIKINIKQLKEEQNTRKLNLEKALKEEPYILDWQEIIDANKLILNNYRGS